MKYFKQPLETLSREDLESLQVEKLSSMLEKVYGKNRFYTKKFEASDINPNELKTLEDFYKLLVMNQIY